MARKLRRKTTFNKKEEEIQSPTTKSPHFEVRVDAPVAKPIIDEFRLNYIRQDIKYILTVIGIMSGGYVVLYLGNRFGGWF